MTTGLVLADDATGALECASLLARLHRKVTLILGQHSLASGLLVVDTESRHVSPDEAQARIRRWTASFTGPIFKKTDSTLRGNIGAELLALDRPVVYVPAYPALGRTVKDGHLSVHGIPVHETDFSRDPRHPVASSAIIDLFPADTAVLAPHPHDIPKLLEQGKIVICDAESNQDLDAIAAALHGRQVTVAGPAGFLSAWAHLYDLPASRAESTPPLRKWLIVCGSRHPQSRRQADVAESLGLTVIASEDAPALSPDLVARQLAEQAAEVIASQQPDAVLIMGGDTAWALWRTLNITSLIPLPEVLPGVAACRSPEAGLTFVTKAGGFGDDSLVKAVIENFS